MTTEPREELLSAYLDDELSPGERAQVEAWLAESAEYRQLYDELRAVRQDLERLPRHKLDKDLGPAVLGKAERTVLAGNGRASIAGRVQPRSAIAEWWSQGRSKRMLLWPAAAIAAALVIAMFNARQQNEREVARDDRPVAAVELAAESRSEKDAETRSAAAAPGEANGREMHKAPADAPKLARPAFAPAAEQLAPVEPVTDFDVGARMREKLGAAAPSADAPAGAASDAKYNYALKMDSNVQRALANRDQVQLIQCDVSPEFISSNRLEQVLVSNKAQFRRLDEQTANTQRYAITNQRSVPPEQIEQWYAVDATGEQLEKIVTELEQEQGQKRLSNLALGLQQQSAAPKLGLADEMKRQAGDKAEKPKDGFYSKVPQPQKKARALNEAAPASEPAAQAQGGKVARFPPEKRPISMYRKQQPVTIWLRATDDSQEPASPASPQ